MCLIIHVPHCPCSHPNLCTILHMCPITHVPPSRSMHYITHVPHLDLCIIMPMCPITHVPHCPCSHPNLCTILHMCPITHVPPSRSMHYITHVPHLDLCIIMPMCPITHVPHCPYVPSSMCPIAHVPLHLCAHYPCAPSPLSLSRLSNIHGVGTCHMYPLSSIS